MREVQGDTGCCRKRPQSGLSGVGEVEGDRCWEKLVRGIFHVAEISGMSRN